MSILPKSCVVVLTFFRLYLSGLLLGEYRAIERHHKRLLAYLPSNMAAVEKATSVKRGFSAKLLPLEAHKYTMGL